MDLNFILHLLKDKLNLSVEAKMNIHPCGIVNKVYRLVDGERSYAVKWLGYDDFSGIDRQQQFLLQKTLAKSAIAPEPVWLSDDKNIWVEQWEDNADPNPDGRSVDELAYVLAYIHRLPISATPLNLYSRWLHYIQMAGLKIDDSLFNKAVSMREQVFESEQQTSDYVFCHNDLYTHHIIRHASPFIVDWEYAAMGNRFFDVASCAKINALSNEGVLQLARAYAREISRDEDSVIVQVQTCMQLVNITNELWLRALETTQENNS